MQNISLSLIIPGVRIAPQISVGFWEAGPLFHIRRPVGLPCWILFHPHTHPVSVRSGGKEHLVGRHGLVLIKPHTPYEAAVVGDWRNYWEFWANFTPPAEWDTLLNWPELAPGVMHLEMTHPRVRRAIVTGLRRMCAWEQSGLPGSSQLAFNSLEQVLLLSQALLPAVEQAGVDPRVQTVLNTVRTRLAQPGLTVAQLAHAAHISTPHLRTLFVQQVGQSPKRYLEAQRVRRAQHLLASTVMPIKQVAAATGFRNPFHFSARFRKTAGVSPKDFRKQARG